MAIADCRAVPSAGFVIRNRKLVQVGKATKKTTSVVVRAEVAAALLLFNPSQPVQLDTRRGTAEGILRIRLRELDLIDED